MTFSFSEGTDIYVVRILTDDRESPGHFSDEEITAILGLNGGDVYLSAADMLDSWASSLAVHSHDVQLGDYREMTHHAAREMGAAARRLRDAARVTPAFAFARYGVDGMLGFAANDLRVRAFLRGELG